MKTNYYPYYQNYTFATTYPIQNSTDVHEYYLLVYRMDVKIYILSAVDIYTTNTYFLYSCSASINYAYSYSIMLLMKILSYDKSLSSFYIDVTISNLSAISLYAWLGYLVVIQRHIVSYKHILCLQNTKVKAKNFWRRYLILKYL